MRLLFLNHNVARSGGTFFRAYHLAQEMVRRGHDVTLVTVSRSERFAFKASREQGVQIVETPDLLAGRGRTGWDPWDVLNRIGWTVGQSWDLVHAFDSRPVVILPALALKARGMPLVLDWADWWGRGGTQAERLTPWPVRWAIDPIETFFEERFRRKAHGTTVISSALRHRALHLGVPARRLLVLRNGSDVDGIRPRPRLEARRRIGVPDDDVVVGHMGALFPGDVELLIETFRIVRRRLPRARLALLGNHRIDHSRYVLDADVVIDSGYVSYDTLQDYLASCDVMLLPLRDTIGNRGRWPSKLNDYMAAGRATVATTVGDLLPLFAPRRIGVTVEPTPQVMAEAAVGLIGNTELRDRLEVGARETAERDFAWSVIGAQLERHYEAVLDDQ